MMGRILRCDFTRKIIILISFSVKFILQKKKQVELGFLRCVKYVPAEFRVDPYIEIKGQMEVKVT